VSAAAQQAQPGDMPQGLAITRSQVSRMTCRLDTFGVC
jgi:hypothetical protein